MPSQTPLGCRAMPPLVATAWDTQPPRRRHFDREGGGQQTVDPVEHATATAVPSTSPHATSGP